MSEQLSSTLNDGQDSPSEAAEASESDETPQSEHNYQPPESLDVDPRKLLPNLGIDPTPGELSVELLRIGRMLTFYEHQHGIASSHATRLKDQYDLSLMMATARIEAKTEKAKTAQALDSDHNLARLYSHLSQADSSLAEMRGIRDALKASYDTISRTITILQLAIEMQRTS